MYVVALCYPEANRNMAEYVRKRLREMTGLIFDVLHVPDDKFTVLQTNTAFKNPLNSPNFAHFMVKAENSILGES